MDSDQPPPGNTVMQVFGLAVLRAGGADKKNVVSILAVASQFPPWRASNLSGSQGFVDNRTIEQLVSTFSVFIPRVE